MEAVSKKIPIILKNNDFCEYVKFMTISWKIDILSIIVLLETESENYFSHNVTHITVIIFPYSILFLPNRFLVKYRLPFAILRFLAQNHLA